MIERTFSLNEAAAFLQMSSLKLRRRAAASGMLNCKPAKVRCSGYHWSVQKWTQPNFSGSRRTKAGMALRDGAETAVDLEVIHNWRAAHSLPLQVIKMMLKGRALNADKSAIVAQRLKRLPSIRNKLQRESIRLQQMQDLGGCRAIVKDRAALKRLIGAFEKAKAKAPKREELRRHILAYFDDYIATPKPDGYRGLHYIYKYRTNTKHLQCYEGLLIEIQLRTRLQHAWATAVEIVDAFTQQNLKSALRTNIGDPDWRRFFALAGSFFALEEGDPPVPGTPTKKTVLVKELKTLGVKTKVGDILAGLRAVVEYFGSQKTAKAYVLRLETANQTMQVFSFDTEDEAQQKLLEEEAAGA